MGCKNICNGIWTKLKGLVRCKEQAPVAKKTDNLVEIISEGEEKPSDILGHQQRISAEEIETKDAFKHMEAFRDVTFRALFIDDKVCNEDKRRFVKLADFIKEQSEKIEVIRCEGKKKCSDCDAKPQCKLKTIKQLMDDDQIKDNLGLFEGVGKNTDYFYWKESGVETYYCPTIIEDFVDNDDGLDFSDFDAGINVYSESKKLGKEKEEEENKRKKDKAINVKCDFAPKIYNEEDKNLHVQIVGVRDVRTALLLLSKYKFDIIFSDYLLDKKDKDSSEREYANQLFEFLNQKQITDEQKKEYQELKKIKYGGSLIDNKKEPFKHVSKRNALETLRHDVLDNRGPLGQLWIMPITGFNQTFIQDIYRNGVNLIDYKWNISNGADPITTPWQFLYHLNKFIELQLKSCVYRMDHLLRFVKNNCEGIIKLDYQRRGNLGFLEFQSFMGAEYANFMRRYGNRHLVQRDAVTDRNDKSLVDKSVFATYIWNYFYANSEYRDEIELDHLIQRFLRHASIVHNDRSGQQRLEETFGQLCFFIDTNEKVQTIIEKDNVYNLSKFDFHEKMLKLKIIMDNITSHSKKKQQCGK